MIIAKEKHAPFKINADESNIPIFARVDVDTWPEVKNCFSIAHPWLTPIISKSTAISHPSRWDQEFFNVIVLKHLECAKDLAALGYNRIVIGADDDGVLQKILSPRFGNLEPHQRIKPLLDIFMALRDIIPNPIILLTVEELAPNGLDATDGIFIAKTLEECGLKEIIASCGTKDFLPLYNRRTTQKKHENQDELYSNEPNLASALWLLENTNLSVWCLTFIDNEDQAINIATSLGLMGLIEKA